MVVEEEKSIKVGKRMRKENRKGRTKGKKRIEGKSGTKKHW